ncbi:RNA-binding ATPase activator esf2 [Fusarium irregulare]|uniref:18S rRNA factor 2 n=1 Tax=Fusarium irregulare TaxID=2494466 RepID=A0A9W8PSE3_9HYPO|nr:RNA-binding ATPase activator esf2 [Fusarium irregulare]KAJ4015640.1 RNA-binding ATPase activator esf2 [Fusarium irregulare]
MAPETKNEFLEIADSDAESDVGYNSEEDDMRKGGRSAKQRKADSDSEDDLGSDGDRDDSDDEDEVIEKGPKKTPKEDKKEDQPEKPKRKSKDTTSTELPDITKTLTKKNLVASEAAIKKSGVVYLSRIPPFMKPTKLRSLLEPYGTINRIFLAPEDPASHARRVKAGGNKKRSYTEGWVEFTKKKDAKAVCDLLNARTIGGKKGGYYHDDLWNLLYLKGFKWHNLTEQIAVENAERTSRMRAEISKSTKENKEFVRNVEKAKMLDGMAVKAKTKKRKADNETDGQADESVRQVKRSFKQVPLAKKKSDAEEQPAEVTRVLSKIF